MGTREGVSSFDLFLQMHARYSPTIGIARDLTLRSEIVRERATLPKMIGERRAVKKSRTSVREELHSILLVLAKYGCCICLCFLKLQ